MSVLTENELIRMMRDEYHHRLLEVIQETDVYDDRGNMIIGKDLKVKHKDSQYEYTVDDVEEEGGNNVNITLNLPEEPRVQPPSDATLPSDMKPSGSRIRNVPPGELGDEEIFIVDKEEFEKEYEVK